MPEVLVSNLKKKISADQGEDLLGALYRAGIEIESYCGGMGSCGKCVVIIQEGSVSPPNSLEEKHLKEKIKSGFRLACQVKVGGDLSVDISPSYSAKLEVKLEAQTEAAKGELPVKREKFVLSKPPIGKTVSLQDQMEEVLALTQIGQVSWSQQSLLGLSRIAGQKEQSFEAVFDPAKVRWVCPFSGEKDFLGMAFDLGTTTIAGELVDLTSGVSLFRSGALNRQARYGADVISRLRAIQDDPANLARLQELVIKTMDDLIEEACEKTGHDPERIFALSVAGNTIMEHIFLGASPLSIGVAPYTPVFLRERLLDGKELNLSINPEAQVYVFPSIAGYVGGDIVSGLAAYDMMGKKGVTLYVDVGTNGEIVLLDGEKVYCCGTAAGPAFEGAQIYQGTRATLGAISAVEFKDNQLRIFTIGDVSPRGICGTGLIDSLACLVQEKLITPTGRLRGDNSHLKERLREGDKRKFFILSEDPEIVLTQEDISQLQLAKAALQAGREILLKEAQLKEKDIEEVILAGAFGSFINPKSAQIIGLIPRAPRVRSVGNASLLGAKKALLSLEFRRKVSELAQKANYIELSSWSDFQDHFYQSLIFEV
ncbi:MAG: hypothetical protein PWP04_1586 [Candidatus Atribacteria bacterium]|nr:hypothetical protein [Candidatus Atribacteria bacterium]